MTARLSDKADLAVSCVDLPASTGVEDARWETFQIAFLNDVETFRHLKKARQIAASYTMALDAVCDSLLNPDTPHTFVSINQDEAAEKIRYANSIIDNWHAPPGYPSPQVIKNNATLLEFKNKSRLISFPCRPPRGLPKNRIYLDEMAHYRANLARAILQAAQAGIIKGGGYMRIGSSPLGASGPFWEIGTNFEDNFPDYTRTVIPWWHVRYMCLDVTTARRKAPGMETKQRVEQFGTEKLQLLFRNAFIEDFQQEFECYDLDESVAWHPWEIIQRNQHENHKWFFAKGVDQARRIVEKVLRAIRSGKIENRLYAGVDIGRVHDLTELIIVGKTTTNQLPLRVRISLANVEHPEQEEIIVGALKELPIVAALIDSSGMGGPLAEAAMKATKGKALGVNFTNANKEAWAVETRTLLTTSMAPLPKERDLAYQIHEIKRFVTATRMYAFDADRNEKGHADAYWAWALALWAAKTTRHGTGFVV